LFFYHTNKLIKYTFKDITVIRAYIEKQWLEYGRK
jgi:hypothetical protein